MTIQILVSSLLTYLLEEYTSVIQLDVSRISWAEHVAHMGEMRS
jgi:hypothetical protein